MGLNGAGGGGEDVLGGGRNVKSLKTKLVEFK